MFVYLNTLVALSLNHSCESRQRWSSPIDFSALVIRIQDSHQGGII